MMNKTVTFLMILLVSQVLFAQKTIENPKHGYSSAYGLQITKIELTDSFTILSFRYAASPGAGFYIPKESYILPDKTTEKLSAVKADKVGLNSGANVGSSGKIDYALYFPAIDSATSKIEFGEGNQGGNWFIYDIELNKESYHGLLPESIIGNWYASDGSKDLIVALYDSAAVYKSQIWKYGKVTPSKNNLSVELVNPSGKQTLLITQIDTANLKMVTSKKDRFGLCKYKKEFPGFTDKNDQPYSEPIFTKEGQATYKGFIRYYSPRYGQKTGQVFVNNIITGDQETYNLKIADDGSFSVTFPLNHPQSIYVRMPYANESVFVEPGKETFHILDGGDWQTMHLFMGEMARVNAGLNETRTIQYFDYNKIQDTILSLDPAQYKAYCYQLLDWELLNLKTYAETHYMSQKALQVKRYNLNYDAAMRTMEYKSSWEGAYRKKNNIPWENRKVKIDIPEPDSSFYSFLNNDFVNDPLASMAEGYYFFINRIKFLDILRSNIHPSFSATTLTELVKKSGKTPTPEEKELISKSKAYEEDSLTLQEWEKFNMKYDFVIRSFKEKNQFMINELQKNEAFIFYYDIEDSLKTKGIEITAAEKEMINTAKSIKTREQFKVLKSFSKEYSEAIQSFLNKYFPLSKEFDENQMTSFRNEKLKQLCNIDKGFAADIMYAQDLCRSIVQESTPMETEELKSKLTKISTPFIAEYVLTKNEETKKIIEANKLKTGYSVNLTPNVEADKLFDAMIAKFKGKVVFVDFWATWCSPCRQGMEHMKPLKEELEGKNIVFVCITNQTSPEATWKNMITDIKGEHFRVNSDEWNTLSAKFNISGIPHYVLVDKNGVVAKNDGMPEYDLSAMKKIFEELMAK
jgi:thiol-disulfide isomerase/thioredoxin